MIRIGGVYLPESKRVEYGLTYVYGVGLPTSREILTKLAIDFSKRVRDLDDGEVAAIQKEVTYTYKTGGDLRNEIKGNIRRLRDIKSYRGLRHARSLPARGQRTKTNARTRKGPRRAGSAVALKRKITKK